MDLHAERGNLAADIGGETLGNRRQQIGAGLRGGADFSRFAGMRGVERDTGCVADRTRGRGRGFHRQQHAADIGMFDDRRHFAGGQLRAQRPALPAFLRIGQCMLIGRFGDCHALRADQQAGVVHHREHAGEAAIFLADQRADGAAVFAIGHDAGRAAVNAELFLDADAMRIVAFSKRTVWIHEEFRHEEERYPLRAGWRIGQTREHEMDDVVGHVVIAIGDVDLGAGDPVGAVAGRNGLRFQCVEIGTRLRFGEVHGAGPFARNQLGEIEPLLLLGAMRRQRLDGALAQDRTEAEGHAGRIPHFLHRDGERGWQALTAIFGRRGEAAPAARNPLAIGISKAGRH